MKRRGEDRFTPWRSDFLAAAGFVGVAGFLLMRMGQLLAYGQWGVAAGALLLSLGMLAAAAWAWRNGMRRWHGAHVERWAIARLAPHLDRAGIAHMAGVRVPGLGDADLVLLRGGVIHTVIEIKSYRRWGRRGDEPHAIHQAARLAQRLGAQQAIVWLPRGTPTLWQRLRLPREDGVMVVFDSPRRLGQRLRGMGTFRRLFVGI